MYEWNTTDGGPCFFRPTGVWNSDNPIYDPSYTGEKNVWPCADYINGTIADGEIVVKESNQCSAVGATFDKNAIQVIFNEINTFFLQLNQILTTDCHLIYLLLCKILTETI